MCFAWQAQGFRHVAKYAAGAGVREGRKNVGRRGGFEEGLKRCASRIRHGCKAAPGSWWHGPIAPNVERRVAVRHKFQSPRRQWPKRVATGLRRVRREDLVGLFPDGDFAGALRTLAAVGDNFCFHRFLHESLDDAGGYLLGLRIRVLTLYCTVKGFELHLRWAEKGL